MALQVPVDAVEVERPRPLLEGGPVGRAVDGVVRMRPVPAAEGHEMTHVAQSRGLEAPPCVCHRCHVEGRPHYRRTIVVDLEVSESPDDDVDARVAGGQHRVLAEGAARRIADHEALRRKRHGCRRH